MVNHERLIKEVRKYPLLWNHSMKGHKKPKETNPLWETVAEALQLPNADINTIQKLKSNFKRIKDHYRTEHKKCITSDYISHWPLYPLCHFMGDIMNRNENKQNSSNENIKNGDSPNPSLLVEEVFLDNENELDLPVISDYDTSVVYAYGSENEEVKSRREEIKSLALQNEAMKLNLMSELVDAANSNKPTNPDTQFLLSLLPYFEGIPKKTNLELRTAIMNRIADFFDINSCEE